MKETEHLRNLMESIQLNEYLVRPGESVEGVLGLNIFADAEERPSEYEEEFNLDQGWNMIEDEYYGKAAELEKMVMKASKNGVTLSDEDVDAIHDVWYDGSDAYDDPETAREYLPDVYERQIELVRDIIGMNEGTNRKQMSEDWGSSDWYSVIKSMDEYIDRHGLNPDTIKDAAREAALFWGDMMGHDMHTRDGEEDAIEDCIGGWMRMSKRGQQLQKMFAPVKEEEINEASNYKLEKSMVGDRETIIISHSGRVIVEMDRSDFDSLIAQYRHSLNP